MWVPSPPPEVPRPTRHGPAITASAIATFEYGLIAAGIVLAIIAVVNGLGSKLHTKFVSINSSLK